MPDKSVTFDQLDEKDRVEFKLTVLPEQEAIVQARLQNGHTPTQRTVYFFDTKDLRASGSKLVLRARITDGEGEESTIKHRPADLTDRVAPWRSIDKVKVEVDVVGEKRTASAKLDRDLDPSNVQDVAETRATVSALFSGKQQKLFEAYAPDKLMLDDLRVLGPIDAEKWELENLDGFPYKLSIEIWTIKDVMRFTELSIKVPAPEASTAEAAFRAYVSGLGLDVSGQQETKTARVLQYFADRLTP